MSVQIARLGLTALAAALSWGEGAQAGPWVQESGGVLAILRKSGVDEWAASAANTKQLEAPQLDMSAYVEWGVLDDLTLISDTRKESAAAAERWGGDVGLRWRVWEGEGFIAGAELRAGLPALPIEAQLIEIDNRVEYEFKALGGWSGAVDGLSVYAFTDFGYRIRPAPLGDVVALDLGGGIDLAPDWQFNLKLRHEIRLADNIDRDLGQKTRGEAALLWRATDAIGVETGVAIERDAAASAIESQVYIGLWLRF
jgi:hypothetical protein